MRFLVKATFSDGFNAKDGGCARGGRELGQFKIDSVMDHVIRIAIAIVTVMKIVPQIVMDCMAQITQIKSLLTQ